MADYAKKGLWKPRELPRGDDHPFRKRPELVPRGERNGMAKLTDSDVVKIRIMFAAGMKKARIAREFGVTRTLVYLVVTGKAWRHVA